MHLVPLIAYDNYCNIMEDVHSAFESPYVPS